MLLGPFFLALKILTPTLKAALFPLQGRNSEQHHVESKPHFLLAFILKDLGLHPRPSKWMRIFPLTSGTVEEGTDKASWRSYHCSLEGNHAVWGVCVQRHQRRAYFSLWLKWEHTCYSAVSTESPPTEVETRSVIMTRNTNSSSAVGVDLRKH